MSLPIESTLPDLRMALNEGRSAVLQAPPGAGKTTRVPLALLDEPWLGGKRIVMLEPRRLAARNAAAYMARQLGEEVGQTVGYRIRFDSRVGPKTRIEVVTEGVLTRMLQQDSGLEGVGLVIFDEFHERSLQADLGLALCLEVQAALHEDLRLLVMSATLDGEPVARVLGGAPVITSEGRSFPVETRYLQSTVPGSPLSVAAIVRVVLQAFQEESGSLLVFLPGTAEIRQAQVLLEESRLGPNVCIAPLYGNLSQEAQDAAIAAPAGGVRKIVLATSIAETSLTIEGIRVVVDGGWMRVPRFEPRSGMTRLQTARVTRASADQRRGRAGRLAPGVCYRCWTEETQRALVPFNAPEITQADLAPLVLELAQWGVREAAELAWLDAPPQAALAQAADLLRRLGALNEQGLVTSHGAEMSRLAIHPRLAHMMLSAKRHGLTSLACEVAAVLSERDLLRFPVGQWDPDLRLRLEALHHEGGANIDRGVRQRVLRSAREWQRRLACTEQTRETNQAGLLLAFAYPDRIAQRRPDAPGRYRLSNGRGAFLPDAGVLGREEYLAVAQLDDREREAKIFMAAPLERQALEVNFAAQIGEVSSVVWSDAEQAVLARRQRRLGELVLDEWQADADREQVLPVLLEGIRRMGLSCLPWDAEAVKWRERIQFLRRSSAEDQWPDMSDQTLLAGLESWLAPYLSGMSRRSHLQRLDLKSVLRNQLDWEQQKALDELAPTHYKVPSGSRIPLDYSAEVPVLGVRLQEMFGERETPRIAGGKVPVVLHLLSPAGRPVQVTRDLASFWAGAYHEVRKDLKGRYPKHHWPDDPLQAEPTSRTKRRREG